MGWNFRQQENLKKNKQTQIMTVPRQFKDLIETSKLVFG